jgi:3-hydroxyisobutyrate dehydrogenase-like beta-hydroxyacid dehydrogenase
MGMTPPRSVGTVGLVGCGRMGSAMGSQLLAADWPLVVTDPVAEARDRLIEQGAQAAAAPVEVGANADLVLVVVVDDDQVRDALSGDDGVLAAARPGTIVAVCASVRPDTCQELAATGVEHDVHVLDVALVGGERGAEQGALRLMCGGADDVIRACTRAFAAFATDVCVIGDVGAGQIAKTANNLLLWACIRIDVEAQRLARAYGVEPAKLRPALAVGSGANRPLSEWGMHRLRWPAKDLEVARALADDKGVDMPLVDALEPLMTQLSIDDLHDLR